MSLTTQLLDIILLDEVKSLTLQIFRYGWRQNSKVLAFFLQNSSNLYVFEDYLISVVSGKV